MPFNLGGPELLIVLLIVFVVFGAGKLGEVGGAMGKGIREFRKAQSEDTPALPKESARETKT